MKFPVIAFAGVTATVIGIAGLADGDRLRKGLGDLITSAAPELAATFDNAADSGKGARGTGSREVAQAETPPQADAPPADAPPAVDESALRYFASQGDTARLQAEISRLRALYPNWTPPRDPLAVPRNKDVQLETMWQLYSEGRYAEVRRAIADRQTKEAGGENPREPKLKF